MLCVFVPFIVDAYYISVEHLITGVVPFTSTGKIITFLTLLCTLKVQLNGFFFKENCTFKVTSQFYAMHMLMYLNIAL